MGHGAAHLLDDDAVVAGAVQAQLLQDGPDLQQCQTIAVGRGGKGRERERSEVSADSRRVTGYLAAAAGGLSRA